LQTADVVTTVSHGMAADLMDRANLMEVIFNGFDEDDIPETKSIQTELFTVGYIGSLKPNQNTKALWNAFAELKEEIKDFAQFARLKFTGTIDPFIANDIKALGLEEQLILQGFVSHSEATKIMSGTNLLLLPIPETENNQYILTGKIFEYLANKNAILSIGPTDGNASEVLRNVGRDPMIAYQDKEQIKQQIRSYFEKWMQDKTVFKHEGDAHLIYSRKALTEQLAKQLNKISYD
jgi:glycosyltransferase involved in cell wall biosynthesis